MTDLIPEKENIYNLMDLNHEFLNVAIFKRIYIFVSQRIVRDDMRFNTSQTVLLTLDQIT